MGVENILHQRDFFDVGKLDIRELFQNMSIINGGVAIGDFDTPPALKGCKHHEYVGDAITLIFVIVAFWFPGFHRDRRPCFFDQLFG